MAGTLEDERLMMGEDEEEEEDGEEIPSTSAPKKSASKDKHRYHLGKELRCMMYGFGDDKVPYCETVALLEEIVVEYIAQVTLKAMEVGKPGRVGLEDIWYLIRRDRKKFARVKDLLTMSEELRKARRAFDDKLA